MQTVPFTNLQVNEFGTAHYIDWTGEEKVDGGRKNKKGYMILKVGARKFYYVHRLVARVFVENPAPSHFKVVHHKDHDRSNNSAHNLEWTTLQMNNAQKIKMRLTHKTKTGFRVKFVFDNVMRNWYKIYNTKEEAYQAGLVLKKQLINDKGEYLINCEKTGKAPQPKYCHTCGTTVNNI